MFYKAKNFNQTLDNWNVSNGVEMDNMFMSSNMGEDERPTWYNNGEKEAEK